MTAGRKCQAVTKGVRCQRPAAFHFSSAVREEDRVWLVCGTHLRPMLSRALDRFTALTITRAKP